jgi:hypothetical protein
MSERIRQLEDALAILQSTHDSEPHPLLQPELMKIKSSIDLHSASTSVHGDGHPEEDPEDLPYVDSFGTLAIGEDGAATFYGRSAGHEASTKHPLFPTHDNRSDALIRTEFADREFLGCFCPSFFLIITPREGRKFTHSFPGQRRRSTGALTAIVVFTKTCTPVFNCVPFPTQRISRS